MKTIPFINKLTNACTIALVTVAVGCGQAPKSQDSADASKMEALEKQNELLKARLEKRQKDLDEARADNLGSTTVVAAGPSADEILDELATYLENLDDIKRKVRSTMTYPIFMVLFWPYLWSSPIDNFSSVFQNLANHNIGIYNFYFGE